MPDQLQPGWRLSAALLGILLLAVDCAAGQDAEPISAEASYAAGRRIASPWTGTSFEVPHDMRAAYDAELGGMVLQSPALRAAVFAVSEAQPEDLGRLVIDLLAEQGIRLANEQLERPDERTLRATYTPVTSEGIGISAAAARAGPFGNAAAVFAIAARDQAAAARAAVDEVLASTAWSEPEAATWDERIAGRRFVTGGTSATYSPGGAGGHGSHASETSGALDLCSDGSYAFESRSESYISIAGASAERRSADAHAGQWRLVSDVAGTAYLILEAGDGRFFIWEIYESPDRRCR